MTYCSSKGERSHREKKLPRREKKNERWREKYSRLEEGRALASIETFYEMEREGICGIDDDSSVGG